MVQFQWNGLISSIYFQIIKMRKELSGRKLKQTTFWHENNIPRNKTTNLIAVTFFPILNSTCRVGRKCLLVYCTNIGPICTLAWHFHKIIYCTKYLWEKKHNFVSMFLYNQWRNTYYFVRDKCVIVIVLSQIVKKH